MGNWIYNISYTNSECHYMVTINIIFIMDRACLNGKQDTAPIVTDETIDSPTILYILLCICVFM